MSNSQFGIALRATERFPGVVIVVVVVVVLAIVIFDIVVIAVVEQFAKVVHLLVEVAATLTPLKLTNGSNFEFVS